MRKRSSWSKDGGNTGTGVLVLITLVALIVLLVIGMQAQSGVDPEIAKAQREPVTMAQMGISSTTWAELKPADNVAPTKPPSRYLRDYQVVVHVSITNSSDAVHEVEFQGPAIEVMHSGAPVRIAAATYFTVQPHSRLITTEVHDSNWSMAYMYDLDSPFTVVDKGRITTIDHHPVTG